MKQEIATVTEHHNFQGDYRILRLTAPAVGPLAKPGQFLHLLIPRMKEAVLRRPFSIFQANAEGVAILYKPAGRGTNNMLTLRKGEQVDIIGPLGNGFPELTEGKTPVLVAGGYGNAALYLLAKNLPVKGTAFFGGRTAMDILCVKEFKALGWDVRIATEDGSLGIKGRVTDISDPWIKKQENVQALEFFACGPNGMLRAIAKRAIRNNFTAWLSLDKNMACGVGACLTCVIKRRTANGWEWARCCKDGPIFESREIIWDE